MTETSPDAVERQTFAYKSYEDYIHQQRRRASRTQPQTKRYAWYREQVARHPHELCPAARSMLCLGARSDVEILDFRRLGFDPIGIDLYATEHIVKCDMTRIDRHRELKTRRFDVFASIHSIEHCLDFAAFQRCLQACEQALACVTPQISEPTAWDCSAFRFAHPETEPHEIEKAFPGFKLGWREVHRNTLMFILLRQEEVPPMDAGESAPGGSDRLMTGL